MGAQPQRETPFGRYVLLSKIATGGMAEIFLARDARGPADQLLVIKRILPHLGENQEFVQMFLDEARLAHHLRHPNVIALFDVGAVDDQYFIAMEYLRGMDLRRLMRKVAKRDEWIPLDVAVSFAMGGAEGLHHAHECRDERGRPLGIVHRDVSPQNVFATVDGQVKVLDFGIAKAESRLTETRTGVLKGKYSYMSPEQASSGQVDRRSDVFALGVILFELLTNRRLFKRDNEILTLKAVIDDPIPPASELRPDVPQSLDRIVAKALTRNPKQRYPSALAFSEDLQRWANANGMRLGGAALTPFVSALCADEPDPATGSARSTQGYVSFVRRDDDPAEPGSASSRVGRIGQTGRSRRERSRAPAPVAAPLPMRGDEDAATLDEPAIEDHSLDAPTMAFRSYEEPAEDEMMRSSDAPQVVAAHANLGVMEVAATAVHSATPVSPNALETRPTLPPPLVESTVTLPKARGRWLLPLVAVASVMLALSALIVWRYAVATEVPAPVAATSQASPTATPAFGAIVVQSDVPALALVDGEPAGPTPALVPGLAVGRVHRVMVRADGREVWQDVVLQREGDMATVRLVLAAAPPSSAGPATPDVAPSIGGVAPAPTSQAGTPRPAVAAPGPTTTPAVVAAATPSTAQPRAPTPVASASPRVRPAEPARDRPGTRDEARSRSGSETREGSEPSTGLSDSVSDTPERATPALVGALIDSVPPASVSVDGRSIGRSPARTNLAPGVHTVSLVDSGTMLRYTTRIDVGPGGYSGRIVVPTGRLRVNVLPWAEVYIEGRMRGTTPMPPFTLYTGRYRIRLVNRDIGRDETVTVTVTPNGDARLSRSWQ